MKTDKRQQAWIRKQNGDPKKSILNVHVSGNPADRSDIQNTASLRQAYEYRQRVRNRNAIPAVAVLMKKMGYEIDHDN